jgi:uncharacterized protein YwqG
MFQSNFGSDMEIKKVLEFVKYEQSDSPKTKFGGQPDWIEEHQWPTSRELGIPMRFIGQINIGDIFPEHSGKFAYIFMTEDDEEYVDETWEPDGGENAVIIQPSLEMLPSSVAIKPGPSRDEFGVNILQVELENDDLNGCRIGGLPVFMQAEEYPEPQKEWQFIAQLDSCSLPFEINFGDAGVAYVFVNKSVSQGKFLWQCG